MNVAYLDLTDYLAIAAEVTGLDVTTLTKVTRLSLVDKAAVLLVRLTKNHPLPDGNKRAAWVSMRMLVEVNNWTWRRQPTIDDAEATVLAIAAGTLDETGTARWLSQFLTPSEGH